MARSVFYSFHYQNDISRVMIVRNRWVTQGGQMISGIIDHAEFEKLKRTGYKAIKNWIDEQLWGTSATVVLIGAETLNRPYVQYEICQSLRKKNALIGVYINRLGDFQGNCSTACNIHTCVGWYNEDTPIFFDEVADAIYDYNTDDGYNNLASWIETAVTRRRGK